MAYLYPYGDSQQLNLSWFLAKFKELYEYVMNLDPGESSMDTILSRFTEQYDPSTTYAAGDYCIFDGYIYKANRTTSGMFDSGSWDPALPVNDIQGLRVLISQLSQSVEDLEEGAVTNVQYTPGAATANGLLRQTVNGSASTVMTVDKEPTENSQNPVKSGSVYDELTEIKGSLNANESAIAIVADGNTHPAIALGQYVYVKNHNTLTEGLYKATAAIPLNGTISTTNVSNVSDGGLNDAFFPIQLQRQDIANSYFDLTATYSSLECFKVGALYVFKIRISPTAEIPARTTDFNIATFNISPSLKLNNTYVIAPSQYGEQYAPLTLQINSSGTVVVANNHQTKSAAGFYVANFVLL